MPVIIVKFKGKKIEDYPIIIGQGCRIGRKQVNDIVIDNLAVSGFHAEIDSVSTTFVLRDLDSTNGTFVNEKKKQMHNLKHNDVILIGKHELVFDCSDLLRMKNNKSDFHDDTKTRILDTSEFRKMAGVKEEPATVREEEPDTFQNEDAAKENSSFFTRLWQKIFG